MTYRTCPTILSSPDNEYSERHTGQDDEDTKQGANYNSNALFYFLLQKYLGYKQFKRQTLKFSLEKDKDCHNKNQVNNGSSLIWYAETTFLLCTFGNSLQVHYYQKTKSCI